MRLTPRLEIKRFYQSRKTLIAGLVSFIAIVHAQQAATNQEGASTAPAPVSPPAEAGAAKTGGLRSYAFDIQKVHPNGVSLIVTGITLDKLHSAVDVTAVNGLDKTVRLNSSYSNTILQDDKGSTYRLAPPPNNKEIEIQPGESLAGSLVFLGRIPLDSRTLTLVINPQGSLTSDFIDDPQFKITLPLNEATAAGAASDKKKE